MSDIASTTDIYYVEISIRDIFNFGDIELGLGKRSYTLQIISIVLGLVSISGK